MKAIEEKRDQWSVLKDEECINHLKLSYDRGYLQRNNELRQTIKKN